MRLLDGQGNIVQDLITSHSATIVSSIPFSDDVTMKRYANDKDSFCCGASCLE